DAAMSALTRDLRADTLEAPKEYSKYTKLAMTPHLSTQLYLAGDAALVWKKNQFNANLKYQRIAPDYRSLGSYYTQTDIERITISPGYTHKKGIITINTSIGKEHDNLSSKKISQTSRTVGSAMLSLRPKPHYGANFQYSNYGTAQKAVTKSISDTTLLNQVNSSIVVTPYYTIIGKNANHTFTYSLVNQELNDKNKVQSQNFSLTVINHSINYSFGFSKSGLRGDISYFTLTTSQTAGKTASKGVGLGLGKWLLKKKLNSYFSANVSTNSFQGNSDGFTIQSRWTNAFSVTKKDILSLNTTYTNNQSKSNAVAKTFQEYLATISFNHMF
ncbi:MAG: hypothetical protein IT244_05655, partial [Bacteroidia bacterium]|nr:hypothetical protein [Bacteroidia bacterium]